MDDIYELTNRFLSDLEDAKEMRDDNTKSISLYEPFQNFIEVSSSIYIDNRHLHHTPTDRHAMVTVTGKNWLRLKRLPIRTSYR